NLYDHDRLYRRGIEVFQIRFEIQFGWLNASVHKLLPFCVLFSRKCEGTRLHYRCSPSAGNGSRRCLPLIGYLMLPDIFCQGAAYFGGFLATQEYLVAPGKPSTSSMSFRLSPSQSALATVILAVNFASYIRMKGRCIH